MEKLQNWECPFVHRKQGLFLSAYVADIKTDGKKQKKGLMWKKLMKTVDLGEPTLFHDHVYSGLTQRECEPNETGIEQYKKMLETRNSAGPTERLPGGKHFSKKQLRGPMTWKDMLKNAVSYCELAKKKTEQLQKVSSSCLDDHHFKKEEIKSVGKLSEVCSQIVLKCLYLARIGRPDRHSMVSDQTRSISLCMDTSL